MAGYSRQTPRVKPSSPPPYPGQCFADLFCSGMGPPEVPFEISAKPVELKDSEQIKNRLSKSETLKRALLKSQNDMQIAKDRAAKNLADKMANIKAANI